MHAQDVGPPAQRPTKTQGALSGSAEQQGTGGGPVLILDVQVAKWPDILRKDYERKVQTSETLIEVAMIRLLLARLGRRS